MSNISKKNSANSKKSSLTTTSNDLADKFEFYARIVKLNILRKENTDGKLKAEIKWMN